VARTVIDSLRLAARRARTALVAGQLRGPALLEQLLAVPLHDRDAWVDELLAFEEMPVDVPDLPRGAVPYWPSGVDEIIAMVREVPLLPDDELVDLGSGLGRVVILSHLLAGVRARGVEIQLPLVESARRRCAALGLDAVSFVHANAADGVLDGSVFYLYTPFNGDMLARALCRLEQLARHRPIVVCALGSELRDQPWLRPRKTSIAALTLYDSCVPGVPARRTG
jgi:hypothetical protein